jgi:hypothetical protein
MCRKSTKVPWVTHNVKTVKYDHGLPFANGPFNSRKRYSFTFIKWTIQRLHQLLVVSTLYMNTKVFSSYWRNYLQNRIVIAVLNDLT